MIIQELVNYLNRLMFYKFYGIILSMTIEARRTFFGLITVRRRLNPGTTIWFEDGKRNSNSIDVSNVVVVDPDTVRVSRYYDVGGRAGVQKNHPKDVERLTDDRINQNSVKFSVLPGIKETIIWKPTK